MDGKTQSIHDVWFKTDLIDSKDQTADVAISDAVKKLPNVEGMGNVMSLHKAIMLDTTGRMEKILTEIVEKMEGGASFDSLEKTFDKHQKYNYPNPHNRNSNNPINLDLN